MTGSIIQLVANNDNDFSKITLGNPKLSHFKNVIKKITNYSVDTKILRFEKKVRKIIFSRSQFRFHFAPICFLPFPTFSNPSGFPSIKKKKQVHFWENQYFTQ